MKDIDKEVYLGRREGNPTMKPEELRAATRLKESTSTLLPAYLHMSSSYVSITNNIHLLKNSIFFLALVASK